MLENPQENACGSVFIETLQTQILKFHYNLSKRDNPVEMLSFEIWKIFKSQFFTKYFRTTASGRALDLQQAVKIAITNYQKGLALYLFFWDKRLADLWMFPQKL